jgi:polar amino acid transport system substrate-binding protein
MKKKISLFLAAVLIFTMAVSFSGCQKEEAKDVLRIGVDDTYPPMEYRDEDNNLVGFDVDMVNAMAEKMGVKVEWISMLWDGIFLGLDADRYDCIISSVSMTTERLGQFDFTTPYLANGQVIVVKPGDESIKTSADLAGKRVGYQSATTADDAVQKHLEKYTFETFGYEEIIQTFAALDADRIDAIVVDYAVALDYSTKFPEKYVISSAKLTNEPIAICVKKGNTELLDKLQSALDEIREDGTLKEISEKWFNLDLTSNISTELY